MGWERDLKAKIKQIRPPKKSPRKVSGGFFKKERRDSSFQTTSFLQVQLEYQEQQGSW